MQITADAEMTKLSTEELEKYIDPRYEAEAPQVELNALETQYAQRVSEDDLNMTEDEPNMSEEIGPNGGNLELGLIEMYRRYLQPQGQRDGLMDNEDIIGNIRANLEDAGFKSGGLKKVSDKEVLAAAKDLYEYKKSLIVRYKSKNKIINIPNRLKGLFSLERTRS